MSSSMCPTFLCLEVLITTWLYQSRCVSCSSAQLSTNPSGPVRTQLWPTTTTTVRTDSGQEVKPDCYKVHFETVKSAVLNFLNNTIFKGFPILGLVRYFVAAFFFLHNKVACFQSFLLTETNHHSCVTLEVSRNGVFFN